MNENTNKFKGPPHPMAGKISLTGYTALAARLGVPRSTAVNMVNRGQVQALEQKNEAGNLQSLVVNEREISDMAVQLAVKAEMDWNRNQDRAKVARVLNDPDRATDNDLIYALARTTEKQHAELYWHFCKRKEAKRPFIEEKYENEVSAIEAAKATFPRVVKYFNANTGCTETRLAPPLHNSKGTREE